MNEDDVKKLLDTRLGFSEPFLVRHPLVGGLRADAMLLNVGNRVAVEIKWLTDDDDQRRVPRKKPKQNDLAKMHSGLGKCVYYCDGHPEVSDYFYVGAILVAVEKGEGEKRVPDTSVFRLHRAGEPFWVACVRGRCQVRRV